MRSKTLGLKARFKLWADCTGTIGLVASAKLDPERDLRFDLSASARAQSSDRSISNARLNRTEVLSFHKDT